MQGADPAFDDDGPLAGEHSLVHPALGALPIADHPPVLEFLDDLDRHLLAGQHPFDRIFLARPDPQFTWSERRLTKRGNFCPASLSAAEARGAAMTRRPQQHEKHETTKAAICRLDITPRLLLMPDCAFRGHCRHAVETAFCDRHPQAPGPDRDPDDGAFRLSSQP